MARRFNTGGPVFQRADLPLGMDEECCRRQSQQCENVGLHKLSYRTEWGFLELPGPSPRLHASDRDIQRKVTPAILSPLKRP
ncbi:hypothetical protein SBA3_3770023 [Candidatus Sulfopaludibacter sp. SbA3]|nr:hypothetical protein SBA3_3770023 [Candidatus Sulfopaludibacter sp. SbA3]